MSRYPKKKKGWSSECKKKIISKKQKTKKKGRKKAREIVHAVKKK